VTFRGAVRPCPRACGKTGPDRRLVRRLNVDGDGQGDLAGLGGEHRAVLVYQITSCEVCQKNK
jgi:MOSC domain-containing protein YiiM